MASFTRWFYLILGAVIAVLLVKFALDNATPVVIHFFDRETEPMPLWSVVIFSFGLGILFCIPYIIKEKIDRFVIHKRFNSKIESLKKELHLFRTQPIEDENGLKVSSEKTKKEQS